MNNEFIPTINNNTKIIMAIIDSALLFFIVSLGIISKMAGKIKIKTSPIPIPGCPIPQNRNPIITSYIKDLI